LADLCLQTRSILFPDVTLFFFQKDLCKLAYSVVNAIVNGDLKADLSYRRVESLKHILSFNDYGLQPLCGEETLPIYQRFRNLLRKRTDVDATLHHTLRSFVNSVRLPTSRA
jgi:hypothetical protein